MATNGVPWGNRGCPGGKKIRSGGTGRGAGVGNGTGPRGIPANNNSRPGRGTNRGGGGRR